MTTKTPAAMLAELKEIVMIAEIQLSGVLTSVRQEIDDPKTNRDTIAVLRRIEARVQELHGYWVDEVDRIAGQLIQVSKKPN
jgi:hypothetical protein